MKIKCKIYAKSLMEELGCIKMAKLLEKGCSGLLLETQRAGIHHLRC